MTRHRSPASAAFRFEHAVRADLHTVAAGLAVAHWLPQAATMPQALRLLPG